MRVIFVVGLVAVVACSAPPGPTAVPASHVTAPRTPEVPMSDPFEYAIDRPTRDAGEAIFVRTGIGDPYRTGLPYPIFLALLRAFPHTFGEDTQQLADKFGFVARAPNPASQDLDEREGLPFGMHLTTDPLTNVPFVVTSCALCHAERIRWQGGEALIVGLGNKRVRIHAYDAAFADITTARGFSADHLARLAAEAADAKHITWPEQYREAFVAATLDALRKRATDRADLRARTASGTPGRVATIESFVGPLAQLTGKTITYAERVGWAKVPDVIGFSHRTTLSWDSSGQGSMDLLAVEADIAAGVRVEWLERHPFQGASLGAYLRTPEPRPGFPGKIDRALAVKGKRLFDDNCAHCHGTYNGEGRVTAYEESAIPLQDIGTDPARASSATESFELAANDPALTRGYTKFKRMFGYVPPVLTNVWARAPYGHAAQWPTLAVLAMPPDRRPAKLAIDANALYDLDAVGVRTRDGDELAGISVLGHPFLADLGADAKAVIEYLKTL